ncbi:MAG: HAD-IIIA family hydrolase [Phycisphaerae bacterium]|nr:HAD-IIIA family hydrolase [Phycisphaerae bacterium]
MANAAIFLDRDDTIIEDPGYINDPDQVKLLPGASEALSQLKKMDYKLVVVTNQSAVARGMVSEEVLEEIHERLRKLLGRKRVYLDGVYYCPYHPDAAIPRYRRDSDFRKPNPGMLFQAAEELALDLSQSWMIGNSYSDVAAGVSAGCRTILIRSSINPPTKNPGDPDPDKIAVNIKEAVNIVKMYRQQSMMTPRPTTPRQTVEAAPETTEDLSETDDAPLEEVEEPVTLPVVQSRPAINDDADGDIAQDTKKQKPAPKKRRTAVAKRSISPKPVATKDPGPVATKEREPIALKARDAVAAKKEELPAEEPPQCEAEPTFEESPEEKAEERAAPEPLRAAPAVTTIPSTASGRRFVPPHGGKPSARVAAPSAIPSSADNSRTQEVLNEVMRYLKKADRLNMYDEFSWVKVLAGILQVVVLFFLLLSLWFQLDPTREDGAVLIVLGYAAVLQLMVIAFHLMRDRR